MSKRQLWHPPEYNVTHIRAAQAVAQGTASETDQKLFIDWVINAAASTYDEPFRPDTSDTIAYMLGRRSVGLAIVKLLKLKPGVME